jgi:hypothetical protein
MGLGNLGDLGNLDLGQLQGYLQGVNFPATRKRSPRTRRATTPRRSWSSR